jgi:hypothetical protein
MSAIRVPHIDDKADIREVVAQPCDPTALAAAVRSYVREVDDPLDYERAEFRKRARKDAAALTMRRSVLRAGTARRQTLTSIKHIAHGLAGAGAIFGFGQISAAAAIVEDAVISELAAPGGAANHLGLDELISHAKRCQLDQP